MIFPKFMLRTLLIENTRIYHGRGGSSRPLDLGIWCYSTSSRLGTAAAAPAQTPTNVRLPPGYNAPSAFALFVKEQMKGQNGQRVSEAMKSISLNWNQMSEGNKQHYVDSSKKLSAQLKDEFERLSEDQKNDLLQKRVEMLEKRRQVRKKRELHKFNEETNRPKQPVTSYMLFVKGLMDKRSSQFSSREETTKFAAEAGEKWRNMSEAEKQPFVDEAKANLVKYHEDLEEWKSRNAEAIEEWKEEHEPKKPKKSEVKAKAKKEGGGGEKKKAEKKSTEEGGEKKKAEKKPAAAKKPKKADVKNAVD